ncbi:MAG: tol-pal system protein YbgF [Deferrisomatales bacterium]
MRRHVLFGAAGSLFLAGCAGPASQVRPTEPGPVPAELHQAVSRLELRLDEVTLQLLALRERVEAQEAARAAPGPAREELPPPEPLRVVPLPLPPLAPDEGPREALRTASPEADLYRRAFNAFREGSYGQAIADFREFLARNPGHEYADSAQYWVGEAYFAEGDYERSVVEFHRVVEDYPRRGRVPDALYKIGLAYRELGEAELGAVFLRRLVTEHPRSEAAAQARRLLESQP